MATDTMKNNNYRDQWPEKCCCICHHSAYDICDDVRFCCLDVEPGDTTDDVPAVSDTGICDKYKKWEYPNAC